MAVQRRVVPEDALTVVVAEVDGGLLVGVQTVQQGQGRAAHFAGRLRVGMGVIVIVVVGSGHVAVLRWESQRVCLKPETVYASPFGGVKRCPF